LISVIITSFELIDVTTTFVGTNINKIFTIQTFFDLFEKSSYCTLAKKQEWIYHKKLGLPNKHHH
jgi:hypothetical protein